MCRPSLTKGTSFTLLIVSSLNNRRSLALRIMANGNDTGQLNYVTANRFYVEIESQISAAFTECSGLGVTVKKELYHEGGVNDQQRVILGQSEFSDVTLRRGLTDDLVFWEWVQKAFTNEGDNQSGKNRRRTISILTFNQAGETMQSWTLIGAVPVGWKAPSLQADAATVAIEELTLAYEGLKVTKSDGGGVTMHTAGRDSSGYFT